MSFNKLATFFCKSEIEVLNQPEGWEIINLPDRVIKLASKDINADDLDGFDIKTAIKKYPDHLYVKIFAIKEDEVNDNGDAFSGEELIKGASTFIGAPLFTNHQNDDVEKARGECVHAWYDKKAGGIFIIGRVDKVAYPKLARGIEQGYISGTSMGTSVEYSLCSICHNYAKTAANYCDHIKNRKNRKFSGETKCQYYNNEEVKDTDKCPLCGSTKDSIKTIKHADKFTFEHNYGLKFIENSFVVNPACHDCGVVCVLNIPEVQKKIAMFKNSVNALFKNFNNTDFIEENIDNLTKIGGVQELTLLKDSMNKIESVVQSMLKQKENVSMEFVSDLVKAMADLQATYDELNEMGYAKLPSITGDSSNIDNLAGNEQASPSIPPSIPSTNPIPSNPQVERGDLNGLGNITKPKVSSKKIEDFLGINAKMISKVAVLSETLDRVIKNFSENDSKSAIGAIMSKQEKTAAGVENQQVITEKQLEADNSNLTSRTGTSYESITESKEQLGGSEKKNDTTSDSPQVRKGTYDVITEGQLGTVKAELVRFNDSPDVITEKQWTDLSRTVASNVGKDYTEMITESQLKQLLDNHKFVGSYETITEDQLKNISMTNGLKRWANKNYTLSVMKIATQTIADAIALYHKSPKELAKVASYIQENPDVRAKVAYLTVINSLPEKTEEREALASREVYFNKVASRNELSAIDALIFSAASNGQRGIVAEDVFDSVAHAIKDNRIMEKVEAIVKTNVNGFNNSEIVSKSKAMNDAIKVLDRPEDGKYRIKASLNDIGIPLTDKVAFVKGVQKFAQQMIDDDGVAAVVIKIQVGNKGELIIDIKDDKDGSPSENVDDIMGDVGDIVEDVDDIDVEVDDIENEIGGNNEDEVEEEIPDGIHEAISQDREKIVKEAQMFGGEMGGQGGASQAPGAGATLPQPPAAGPAPVETFTGDKDPLADEQGLDEESLSPLPPGSICPVCGSNDVDVVAGKGKCNNCSSETTIKVELEVTKWKGLTPEGEAEGEGKEEKGFGEGEGFELPEEPAVAAMACLSPKVLQKLAQSNIKIGSVSPATGKTNTISVGDGNYICLDTATKYKIAFATNVEDKSIWAQWEWKPSQKVRCTSCERSRQNLIKALASVKMTEIKFNSLPITEKFETIQKLNQSGVLKNIKLAEKENSVLADYKLAYSGYGKSFPIESCIEKLARRFGQNALALSGPCEGKALADCVCNQLKKADIYTDSLAIKVASVWADCSGDEECIEDQIRSGYNLREAASLCENLKMAIASPEDLLADELGGLENEDNVSSELGGNEGDSMEDIDPFAEVDGGGSTVLIELPKEVAQQLGEKIDKAVGGSSSSEENHEEIIPNNGVEETSEEILPADISGEKPIEEVNNPLEETKPCGDMKPCEQPGDQPGGDMKAVDGVGVVFEEDQIGDETDSNDGQEGVTEENGVECLEENGEDETKNKKVIVNIDPALASENVYDIKEATYMKSKQSRTGTVHLDLTSVVKVLEKQAGDKEIQQENVQDSKDIGSISAGEGGSKMGHEDETISDAKKPSVPRSDALMGQEAKDLNPKDKPQPSIPSDNATMGHEDEAGLSGGDVRYTGGLAGAGKASTASVDADLYHMRGHGNSKDGLSRLVDRLLVAQNKKLEPKSPVSEDPDLKPIQDKKTMGNEPKFDAKEPEKVEGNATESLMGHEKETIESAPKSPADHPDIPTGNAQMGKEELDSEKTTKDKGTVIAQTESNVEFEAYRVAGRMIEAKLITSSQLQTKVNELKKYKLAQIKDFEKAIFNGKKGLDSVSEGLSQPVVINETSSEKLARSRSSNELVQKLSSLFKLDQQNKLADEDVDTQLRRTFNKK